MSNEIRVSLVDCDSIAEIDLDVPGWIPLRIQYGILTISKAIYLVWRVNGTRHEFRVPFKLVTTHHGGNYSEHFKKTLEQFREDYMEWASSGFSEDWMRDYKSQFSHLIR